MYLTFAAKSRGEEGDCVIVPGDDVRHKQNGAVHVRGLVGAAYTGSNEGVGAPSPIHIILDTTVVLIPS